jgi:aspartyl-tRNA(Asn)/glutamyl-tRNA(Gln) amidotransferase subunit B
MPEAPATVRARFAALGLPGADVLILADEAPVARYFDAVLAAGAAPKPAANWIVGDIMAFCKVCWQTPQEARMSLPAPLN